MKYILLCLTLTILGCASPPPTQPIAGETRIIKLTDDGECFLDDQSVLIEDLSELLNPTDQVIIRPSKMTLHGKIISVMDEVAAANVKYMSFATAQEKSAEPEH